MLIGIFLIIEWVGREHQYAIENIGLLRAKFFRWILYCLLAVMIFLFSGTKQEFIYFQF